MSDRKLLQPNAAQQVNLGSVVVRYKPIDKPFSFGTVRVGTTGNTDAEQAMYGTYEVELSDGFHYITGHTGWVGTVSAWSVNLSINPDFVAQLVSDAEEARTRIEREERT